MASQELPLEVTNYSEQQLSEEAVRAGENIFVTSVLTVASIGAELSLSLIGEKGFAVLLGGVALGCGLGVVENIDYLSSIRQERRARRASS